MTPTPPNTEAGWLAASLFIGGACIGCVVPQLLRLGAAATEHGAYLGAAVGAVAAIAVFIYGKVTR